MTADSIRLRKILGAGDAPTWPEGVRRPRFDETRHAEAVHRLLVSAYRDGGGHVAAFEPWWEGLRSDDEYDPELVFLAADAERIVGVAQCWTGGFIKDLAVAEDWRRRGLGAALVRQAFVVFGVRGLTTVDLKVEPDNATGAERLYRSLGMTSVIAVRDLPA